MRPLSEAVRTEEGNNIIYRWPTGEYSQFNKIDLAFHNKKGDEYWNNTPIDE